MDGEPRAAGSPWKDQSARLRWLKPEAVEVRLVLDEAVEPQLLGDVLQGAASVLIRIKVEVNTRADARS
ncbi:MAG TPA: hypothetical protein VMW62_03665 [Chloroflexota bacterium]|nr:hypothetical protein [Chloroflexota bacterium]